MGFAIGRRKVAVILICGGVGFLATFTQYVHSRYVGVVQGSNPLRVLHRGLHLRAPWQRVIFYPTRSGSVGITTASSGPRGTIKADMTLFVSVNHDSVESLHKAYGGEYIQALVIPCVNEFLSLRAEAWADWRSGSGISTLDEDLVDYLNASLAKHGVSVAQAWIESLDVGPGSLE